MSQGNDGHIETIQRAQDKVSSEHEGATQYGKMFLNVSWFDSFDVEVY